MDTGAVVVALIGLIGVLSGHIVSRWGKKAEAEQKKLADRAAHEHTLFEERGQIITDLRIQQDRADKRADRAEEDADKARQEARQLAQDLLALAQVVRQEVEHEALRTAEAIQKEEQ